jgi:hypothetical protein
MTWLGGLLSKWWLKALPVLAAIGAVLGVLAMLRKSGADAERKAQLERNAASRRKADEVDNRVDAAGPAERQRLRDKWTVKP